MKIDRDIQACEMRLAGGGAASQRLLTPGESDDTWGWTGNLLADPTCIMIATDAASVIKQREWPDQQEATVANLHYFKSQKDDGVFAFAADKSGATLPVEHSPWIWIEALGPHGPWHGAHKGAARVGVTENGFFLWMPPDPLALTQVPKQTIGSDRVEGTRVYDRDHNEIGTIKRLLIEKVSGRVLSVDVTFGGFLGIGVHHQSVPWNELTYDRNLSGYSIDIAASDIPSDTHPAPAEDADRAAFWRRRWEQADGD